MVDIPIQELPALPGRGFGYRLEPLLGTTFVLGITAVFVRLVFATTLPQHALDITFKILISIFAGIAILCLLYLLCGSPNVIRRSEETCYPIPPEVRQRLLRGDRVLSKNIKG